MSSEIITVTRAELYEKVWTIPMQKLAKEFGLSDVGLANFAIDMKYRYLAAVTGHGSNSGKSQDVHLWLR